jgi:hypothetical protein
MPVKSHNTVPAIKDRIINFPLTLGTIPTGAAATLFMDLWYDYEIKSMAALVRVVTLAAPVAFTLGYGSYTDPHGIVQPAVVNQFLPAANTLDANGQAFSTAVLPVGSLHVFKLLPDPNGLGLNILRAGSPLVIAGPTVVNTGQITLNVVLRPKDLDRGDSSKRPWGASDEAYASYFK